MLETLQILVGLLVVLAIIAYVASRLALPPSILLVLAGTGLALIPGLPFLELAPELVLLMILPPIIYSAAVAMSWREFRFNIRPIALLAVGCVVVTTLAVGAASHWLLGLSWPIGFTLGAIVSPPDAVAPLSIVRRMHLPRRLAVILEGEGLANDATALILYRFAVAAVTVGSFSFGRALGSFAIVVAGEIVWGIAVGWTMLRLRRLVADVRIEILLSVLTPFAAYWPPEVLGGSGVLATVAAGLYISWNGLRLINSTTRLQGIFFWDFLNYVIEGLVFLVTGLQARTLIEGIRGYSAFTLTVSAAVVCAVVIATRFAWVFPATYVPRWMSPRLLVRDPSPPWQYPFLLSAAGVRGTVSLAAALALPVTLASGAPFPHRDLILFIAFAVILVTLVGQGLALPGIVRRLGLGKVGLAERRRRARRRARGAAARGRSREPAPRGAESVNGACPKTSCTRCARTSTRSSRSYEGRQGTGEGRAGKIGAQRDADRPRALDRRARRRQRPVPGRRAEGRGAKAPRARPRFARGGALAASGRRMMSGPQRGAGVQRLLSSVAWCRSRRA
jgi:Na+/H+ antiporter